MGFLSDLTNLFMPKETKTTQATTAPKTTTPQTTQAPTAYQSNVSTPVPEKKKTSRDILANILTVGEKDPEKAKLMYEGFQYLQSDPTSSYFNPYSTATNRSVNTLAEYGIDASVMDDDWFANNTGWKDYLVYNGTTNTPSSPGTKASAEQKAAYEIFQIGKSVSTTNAVDSEWAALQEELAYWANRTDLNLSDDQIIERINKQKEKKYPTLYKMDQSLKDPDGVILELNHGTDYSEDNMYGVIWAARNGGSTGSIAGDTAMSGAGYGVQWQDDPEKRAKLDDTNPETYSPFSVSSTMYDACLYFGLPSFDDKKIDELGRTIDRNDATAVKFYNQIVDAENFTKGAEEELDEMNNWLDTKLSSATDPNKVMGEFEKRLNSKWSHLKKMDDSMEKIDSLVDTTRAIDYCYNDVKRRVEAACEENRNRLDTNATLEKYGVKSGTDQGDAVSKAETEKVNDVALTMGESLGESERNEFTYAPSLNIWNIGNALLNLVVPYFAERENQFQVETTRDYVNSTATMYADVAKNEQAQSELESTKLVWTVLSNKKEKSDETGLSMEQYSRLKEVYNSEDWNRISKILMQPDVPAEVDPYYKEKYNSIAYSLYNMVNPGSEGYSDTDAIIEQAVRYVEIANNTADVEAMTADEIERYNAYSEYRAEREQILADTAEATSQLKYQQKLMQEQIASRQNMGYDTHELEIADAVSRSIAYFANYEATQWSSYNKYDLMSQALGEGVAFEEIQAAAASGSKQVADELEDVKWLKQYIVDNGIEVPNNYMTNLDRYIAKLERDQTDYNYFSLQGEENFEQIADEGKRLAYENVPTNIYGQKPAYGIDASMFSDLITDKEKQTYYYLYATEGIEAATEYYNYLADETYGVIGSRTAEAAEAFGRRMVNSDALGAITANALAVLSAPFEAIGGLSTILSSVIGGKEYNPNNPMLAFGKFSQTVNEETARNIKEGIAEGPLRDIAMGMYEILYNRGRSMTNAFLTGGLSIGGKFGDILTELAGAAPMAVGAASMAIADAKEKGVDDATAYLIGGVTLAMEDLTEGLTRSNIRKAFAGGEDAALATIQDKIADWLTRSGLEEALGETLTDYVEQYVDKNYMGEFSDHNALVSRIMEENMLDPNDPVHIQRAEDMARAEEIANLVHTAIISFMSPGLDVVGSTAKEALTDYHNIRSYQRQNKGTSFSDARKEYMAWKEESRKEAAARKAAGEIAEEQAPQQAPQQQAPQAAEQKTMFGRPMSDDDATFVHDLEMLETVSQSDVSTQTAALEAVFGGEQGTNNADASHAAAVSLPSLFNGLQNAITAVKNIIGGAKINKISINSVKTALQMAVLSPSSQAAQIASTEEFQIASPEEQAQMLAGTVEADMQNETVLGEVEQAVRESRIAEKEKTLIAQGAYDELEDKRLYYEGEQYSLSVAQKDLEEHTREEQIKVDAALNDATNAANELAMNPTDENRNWVDRAMGAFNKATEVMETVVKQWQDHYDKVEHSVQDAKEKYENALRDKQAVVRQQAEQMVAEEDQQRAELAAQQAEQARIQAEQEEQARLEQEEQNNFARAQADAIIAENYANATDEQKQKIRDVVKKISTEKQMTETEKVLARADYVKRIGKKFGYDIRIGDTTEGGRFLFQNASVTPETGVITLSREATLSDAMYAILGHEVTHIAERAGKQVYDELANALIKLEYGDDTDRMQADIDARQELYRRGLQKLMEQGKNVDPSKVNAEYAKQELVADLMGKLFLDENGNANVEMLNRFAAESPNVAKRVLNAIKSFLKKLAGIEGTPLTEAQKIVDTLEAALKKVKNTGDAGEKFSIGRTSDGRQYVDVDTDQNIFDNLTPKQILLKAESIIKDRFKGLEVDFADGKATVTKRTAEEYARPANRRLDDNIREAKGRASTELDNLLKVGEQIFPGDPDYPTTQYKPDHNSNVKNWSYYRTLFKVAGEQFSGIINIARMDNFSRVHDITKIKYDTSWQALQEDNLRGASTGISGDNVAQSQNAVKPIAVDDNGNTIAVELPGDTVAVAPAERFSLNSFTEDEQERVRNALLNKRDSNGKKVFTKAQVDQYLKDATGIASLIATDKARWDFVASDNQVFLKPNADYYFTLDASTLCAKRLLYQGTFDYVQHALPDEVFTPEDLIDLVNIMADMGYETPCGICYVESRRRWLDTYANKFLNELPEDADAFIDKYFEKATDEDKATIREQYSEWVPATSIDDLTTSDGLEKLRHDNPYMYKAFVKAMNAKGTANPKVVQLRTEYRGDIGKLSKNDVQKVKDIGGLRIQSFSDFETPHLLDMMQAVLDMSSVGLTSQAYTKVPNFAWVFGDTGIKINLSLIGEGTGLDENGNLVFDNREGINFDEAMKLRERYGSNVGTILVGINDEHIVAAMGDPRIDFIIPFHKSGWSDKELKGIKSLNNYRDYTDTQNERYIIKINDDGTYETESFKKHKERTKESLENFQPVGKNGYWNFKKSGQWNAENYLKMCAEQHRIPKFNQFLVDNGDGSFSLPKGTDKRSTAIREGYWKTLIDFKMYENDSYGRTLEDGTKTKVKGAAQKEVTPNVNMAEAYRVMNDYQLGRQMPDQADGTKGKFIPMESNNSVPVATPAGDAYIEMIRQKRAGNKPVAPGPDTLEADLPVNPKASAFGASPQAPAVLGNTEGTTEEATMQQQNAMAIDAETGETVRYSLPNGETEDAIYIKDGKNNPFNFVEKILNNEKKYETRPSESLNRFVNKGWVGITRGGKGPQVEGRIKIGEAVPFQRYDENGNETQIYLDSMIKGTDFDMGPDDTKFAYPILDVEDFRDNPRPILKNRPVAGTYRYSLPSDAPYLSAVDHGNMNEAQKMVDDAAESAMTESAIRDEEGRLIKVYHGTNEQFTVFDMDKGRSTMDIQGSFFSPWELDASGYGENVGAYYLNIKNPAPEQIAYAALRRHQGENEAGRKAKEDLIDAGYDGVNNNNEEYIAFYPEQIKSADAVTYDDDGNVIPLSERFNTKQPDIRYSLPSDNLLEQQLRYQMQNRQLTQEDIDAYQQKTSRPLEAKSAKWSQTEGPAQRQFATGMLQESDEIAQQAKDYALAHNAMFPDTNAAQIERAINWIRKNGSRRNDDGSYTQATDGFSESLEKATSKSFDYRSADGQARMVAMMGMAVAKNDTMAQVALVDAFNRQGTDLGRALQSRKLFRLMTPEGRISTLQKMLQNTQDEINAKGSNLDLKFSDWIYQAAAVATEEGDFQKVQQAAAIELAEQLPANWRDRIRSLRMLSMLANPRTHIRNIIGNAFFVPAVGLKNKLGAIAELGLKQGEKTKTLSPFLSKEARRFAKEDALTMQDTLTGEAKYNEDSMVQRAQKPFSGLLQALIDFNSKKLEDEDWRFLKNHYKRALGSWMMANGYTAEQLESNPDLLEKGRAYAVQEAQKATYRDFNKLAQTLNKVSRDGGVGGFLVDAILPFKKTPANILRRGIEYSPVGIMRSLTTDLYHLKQWNDYQDGKLNALPDKAISPTQFIDRICSGLSGSAIMAVGFLLSSAGFVSCGLDDDDDKLEKEKGAQKYAFKFTIGGKDFTYTMDWAAPMSMPFFVGAAIQEQLSKEGDFDVEEVVNALGNITEPVFNLSMLDGVNTLFKTSQYDDTNTLTQIGAKVLSNYATSYVPSILGAFARTIDPNSRKAFVESGKGNGVLGTFRYAQEQTENKIPFLNQTNIPVRDVWGNAQTSSLAERLIENFISPGYISEYKNDPILNEIGRVYDLTNDASLVPADPAKSVTYKKEKYVLTAEQWDHYKEVRGQTAFEVLSNLINTEDYQSADASVQAQMIKDAWSYADAIGKSTFIPDYEIPKMGDNPEQTIAKDATISGYKSEMIKALNAGDWEAYDTMVEALKQADVEDNTIKTKIGDTYRDQWKTAYRKGDEEKMAEIEEILDNTGFDFNIYGKNGWMDKVDQEND